PTVAPPAPVYR
nr:Chain E, Np [Ebola virus]5VAO_F Chain F, Np [Ebola virus]5VAO_G Chain G, Np [Ebola virus]5VAO_H Chain H, Np [Ebola virus]